MPNPYPIELRERAVRAYEDSTDTYLEVAARFSIAVSTLCEWVRQSRDTGHVMPAPKGGGWYSPVDIPLLYRLVRERPDRTTDEVTRAYMVFIATPVVRQVERIELPSTRAETTATRLGILQVVREDAAAASLDTAGTLAQYVYAAGGRAP